MRFYKNLCLEMFPIFLVMEIWRRSIFFRFSYQVVAANELGITGNRVVRKMLYSTGVIAVIASTPIFRVNHPIEKLESMFH